jgi:hypothetical protein
MKRVRTYTKEQRKHAAFLVAEYRRRIKIRAIEYKDGKCVKCGYNKCTASMEFHHRNPTEKDFQIGSGRSIGWDKIKEELDKCDLVCSNCHHEIHHRIETIKREGMILKVPHRTGKIKINCAFCSKELEIWPSRAKNGKQIFCNNKCHIDHQKEYFKSINPDIEVMPRFSGERPEWPSDEELQKLMWKKPAILIAKELRVSDRAVRKRCQKLKIKTPGVGYWNKVYAAQL